MAPKKKDAAPAPFATAPHNWIRAEFEAAKVTARTGGKDGLPRAMLAHATMRRLRLAVGEKILLFATGVGGAHRKLEPGQAAGEEEGEQVEEEGVCFEAERLISTSDSLVVLAWPSSTTPAASLALEPSAMAAINVEERQRVAAVRLSALPHPLPHASSATLSSATELPSPGPIRTLALSLQLRGRCLRNGQEVSISLDGSTCTFVAGSLQSDTLAASKALPALVTAQTALHFQRSRDRSQEARDSAVEAEPTRAEEKLSEAARVRRALETVGDMVGGIEDVVKEVVEGISGGLFQAEEYRKYNLTPPRGLLLHGPPGTGKTLLAKTVCSALGVQMLCVDAPELVGGYYGDSERKVRELFERARALAPVVIFFDEIDVISSSRERASGEMERRLVSALVQELDKLQGQKATLSHSDLAPNFGGTLGAIGPAGQDVGHRVVVIGATNRVEELDASLRLPGRFDLEIQMPVPTSRGRESILQILLRHAPHQLLPQDFSKIAGTMHGCVGADLELAVNAALVSALRRSEHEGTFRAVITCPDMEHAAATVKPSALREVLVEVPNVKWSDIGGQAEAKEALKEAVEWPLKYPEAFSRMGIRPPAGVLLYGPPGCSKTLMAKALATEASLNFIAVKGPELFRKYVGDSEKAVAATFRRARQAAPSIVFFDEIDALAVNRGSSGDSSASQRVVSQLLNEMDGVNPLKHVLVVAATNRPDLLDTAFVRPGRIDRLIYVAPPDLESRAQILRIYLGRMPCADSVDVEELARSCDGFSGAELANLCREAALQAIGRGEEYVSMEALRAAVHGTKPRITAEMLSFYQNFAKKHAQPSK